MLFWVGLYIIVGIFYVSFLVSKARKENAPFYTQPPFWALVVFGLIWPYILIMFLMNKIQI